MNNEIDDLTYRSARMHARDEPCRLWVTEEDLSHDEGFMRRARSEEEHQSTADPILGHSTKQDLPSGWGSSAQNAPWNYTKTCHTRDFFDKLEELEGSMDLIRCPFCHGVTFPTHVAKEAHMEHEHFLCRRCHLYFNGYGFRQQHYSTSPKHTDDYCSRHNKIFQGQDWRAQSFRHIETEHYPCGTPCQYYFDTEEDLAKHRVREHGRSRCPFCYLSFSDPLKWGRHLNNKHHWCKSCIKQFDCEDERKEHYENSDTHLLTYCHLYGRECHDGILLVRHQVDRHDFLDDGWKFSGDKEAYQEWHHYYERRKSSSQSGHQKWQKSPEQDRKEPQHRSGYWDQSPDDEWDDPLEDYTETWRKQEQARKKQYEQQEQRKKREKDKARAYWDHFTFENLTEDWRSQSESSEDEQEEPNWQKQKDQLPFPDHYATLNVSRNLSQSELEKAAKKRRIEVHPDKLAKLIGLSPEEITSKEAEAREVGCAADVLSAAESRHRYDKQLREWERAQA